MQVRKAEYWCAASDEFAIDRCIFHVLRVTLVATATSNVSRCRKTVEFLDILVLTYSAYPVNWLLHCCVRVSL